MENYVWDARDHAQFRPDKMGKATLFRSERVLIGLNCFLPGQEHKLHAHEGMDKAYVVLSGSGEVTVGEETFTVSTGKVIVAPAGVPHGVRNTGEEELVLLAILAPAPPA